MLEILNLEIDNDSDVFEDRLENLLDTLIGYYYYININISNDKQINLWLDRNKINFQYLHTDILKRDD